jgi:hypothetical protein
MAEVPPRSAYAAPRGTVFSPANDRRRTNNRACPGASYRRRPGGAVPSSCITSRRASTIRSMQTGSAATNGRRTNGGPRRSGARPYRKLLNAGRHREIAARAAAIEARTNLLFSFEKMALRDAVKPASGARAFAQGLYDLLHGAEDVDLIAGAGSSASCRAGRPGC